MDIEKCIQFLNANICGRIVTITAQTPGSAIVVSIRKVARLTGGGIGYVEG